MRIGGLQKFSLLDYPGELSSIIFTQGCNFKCPYCHNPELVVPEIFRQPLDTEKVLRFLYRRRRKITAVVVTGGEPTLQEDLIDFLRLIKAMRFKIKLDTNGSNPEMLSRALYYQAVDYIAMDLKAPNELYQKLTRSKVKIADIRRSMEIIRLSGLPYEFRTTVAEDILFGDDLFRIRDLLKEGDRYYLQPCNYSTTLDDLARHRLKSPNLSSEESFQKFKDWAEQHRVLLQVRGE